jgi:hypothetical protein
MSFVKEVSKVSVFEEYFSPTAWAVDVITLLRTLFFYPASVILLKNKGLCHHLIYNCFVCLASSFS